MSKSKILVGLTGSIACFKTCTLISQLKKSGHEVQVVTSPAALKFVGEATLEGLTQRPVLFDNFTPAHMMDHITLARWTDIFVVAPITAHHINKFALGLADDLITTLYMAYGKTKPLYLAPAMNTVMYEHYTVQESLQKLKKHGAKILEPSSGLLACGEDGTGKMMEPDEILRNLNLGLTASTKSNGRIIVTLGGTRETIDGVRSIANMSTGETGAQLTDMLTSLGYEVTALAASSGAKPHHAKSLIMFNGYSDLNEKLKQQLSENKFSAIIHLAAVSDFSVDKIISDNAALSPSQEFKLGSEKSLTLQLKSNPKIVNQLKSYSVNKRIKVIAFKLTNTLDLTERDRAIKKLLCSAGVDYVVHNDLHNINKTVGTHPFHIYGQNNEDFAIENINELALTIHKVLTTELPAVNMTSKRFEVDRDLMS